MGGMELSATGTTSWLVLVSDIVPPSWDPAPDGSRPAGVTAGLAPCTLGSAGARRLPAADLSDSGNFPWRRS